MTINQLLEEESRKHGVKESVIREAGFFSDSITAPSKKDKEMLAMDLPDELIIQLRAYIVYLLNNLHDPSVRKYLDKKVGKILEKN